MYKSVIAGFSLACVPSILAKPLERKQSGPPMVYGFETIRATTELSWRPCFDNFTCTKLLVPLDYKNKAAGTTHVAFIKWSSNSTTANSTQDILLNPGGPGGSGVSFLQDSLPIILNTIGTDYNLVSFDPRGVNNSGPSLSCFQDAARGTSRLYLDFDKPLDSNDTKSYSKVYQRAAAFGDFCTNAHQGANDTAKYANTIATATDMLHYTELLAKSKGQDPLKSQLWYYGISYGTVLGTTFSTLFPERVERVIVDSVVDGEDYFQGQWVSNLADSDEAVRFFFQTCFDAGKNGTCSFWADSPSAIEARYRAVVEELTLNPIPISRPGGVPDILTVDELKLAVLQVPYNPIGLFPIFADILSELEARNGETLAAFTAAGTLVDTCSREPALYGDIEPRQFIACTDANGRTNLSTLDAFKSHAAKLVDMSEFLGETWATWTAVSCRKLNIKAPASQVLEGYPGANNTGNPLLFISNKVDPVTPLRSAEKMAARFGGARLLVQDAVGHAAAMTPSKCTSSYVKDYFKSGSLPDVGTHCQPDLLPFKKPRTTESAGSLKRRHFLSI